MAVSRAAILAGCEDAAFFVESARSIRIGRHDADSVSHRSDLVGPTVNQRSPPACEFCLSSAEPPTALVARTRVGGFVVFRAFAFSWLGFFFVSSSLRGCLGFSCFRVSVLVFAR
jgi:hypothetical protein